jgi:hypothetical protein
MTPPTAEQEIERIATHAVEMNIDPEEPRKSQLIRWFIDDFKKAYDFGYTAGAASTEADRLTEVKQLEETIAHLAGAVNKKQARIAELEAENATLKGGSNV